MDWSPDQFAGHGLSVSAILIAWTGVLSPVMAALATIAALIWYSIQIAESKPVQRWLKARRRRALHRLRNRIMILEHQAKEKDD